mgnify:FL=1
MEYIRNMESFVKVMKALSDPIRVKMLKMLQEKELCVCEIYTGIEISQPAASKHLKTLMDAGLVKSEKQGLWVNYSLFYNGPNPFACALLGNLALWLEEDEDVKKVKEQLPFLDREKICGKDVT